MQVRPKNQLNYLDLFLYPLRGTVLMTLVGLSLLFLLARKAGLFGLWLNILTTVALAQYVFVIIRHSSLGHKEPPPLSIADFNPVNTAQPLAIAVLLFGVGHLTVLAAGSQGTAAAIAIIIVTLISLPAILASMAMEGGIARAFSPLNIITIARGFGTAYLVMVMITLTAVGISALLSSLDVLLLIEIAVSVYAFFLMAGSIGRLIYASRDEIGLEVYAAPETREHRDAARALEEHKKMLDQAWQSARTNPDKAVLLLKNYQHEQHLDIATTHWMFNQLQLWDNPATALWFAQSLIARQVALGQTHEALKVALWCLGKNRAFRPQGPADTYSLGRAAIDNGQFKLGTALLQDFGQRFPEDHYAVPALILAAKIAAERLNATVLAQGLIEQLYALGVSADDERLKRIEAALVTTNS